MAETATATAAAPAAAAEQTTYVPVAGDFEFLTGRDIETDENFASQGYWKGVVVHFLHDTRAMVGLVIVVAIILLAVFAPIFSPYGYRDIVSYNDESGRQVVAAGLSPQIGTTDGDGPFSAYTFLFGTDALGRDLWTRTWEGTRVSLIIAFVTILIDMVIGMSYGLISGYFGGAVDNVMQRIVEVANSVPRLVWVSVLAIFMPKGMGLVIVALLLTEWIGMSKIARAEMLRIKESEYVLASRTLGAGSMHIIFSQILPNTIGPIITQVMFSIPTAIFTEAFLSFVGVGIVLPQCSIGSLIESGFENITTLPYQIVPPIAVLALLMLGFNFVGDGLREALAPKLEDM